MNKELTAHYQRKVEEENSLLSRLRNRSRAFILAEVSSFLLAIGFVVVYTLLANAAWTLACGLLALFLYVYIRKLDVRNDRRIKAGEAMVMTYENEINYHHGDFSKLNAGTQYVNPQHPYTYDLDVFGAGSLFQRINRTISTGGSDQLAECLSKEWGGIDQREQVGQIHQRMASIQELGQAEAFLTRFKSFGVKGQIQTKDVLIASKAATQILLSSSFPPFLFCKLAGFLC